MSETPSPVSPIPPLRGMDLEEMTALLKNQGFPLFRAKQLLHWVYERRACQYDEMTNLPKRMRGFLKGNVPLGGSELIEIVGDANATQKMVFQTKDKHFVEGVLMRDESNNTEEEPGFESLGEIAEQTGSTPPAQRVSFCVSSQIGCALACKFCVTGLGGFRRNLRTDEIVDQILQAQSNLAEDEHLSNLVFMGMGEPLLNLDNVIPALRIITSADAVRMATRRITVSTAGVIPGIRRLSQANTGVNLAISLNATTQKTRDQIMPGCRKWPITELLTSCRSFPLAKRRRITFEYVLLDGVNDSNKDHQRLVQLTKDIPSKINLILFNPDSEIPLRATSEEKAVEFQHALLDANCTVSLRRSKGRRHSAACGQLAAHFRRENSEDSP